MDFLFGLPKPSNGYDGIWVIVDRLTKTARFVPVKVTFTLDKLAKLYVDRIVSQYGAPVSIVSDRDPRFTSSFGHVCSKHWELSLSLVQLFILKLMDNQKERFRL